MHHRRSQAGFASRRTGRDPGLGRTDRSHRRPYSKAANGCTASIVLTKYPPGPTNGRGRDNI